MAESDEKIKSMLLGHITSRPISRMPGLFMGTAGEASARADGQADVGEKLAGLINDLNSFVSGPVGGHMPSRKKVSGKMGIEEMLDYLRLRFKDMVFDLEATHRELAAYIENDEFNC